MGSSVLVLASPAMEQHERFQMRLAGPDSLDRSQDRPVSARRYGLFPRGYEKTALVLQIFQ